MGNVCHSFFHSCFVFSVLCISSQDSRHCHVSCFYRCNGESANDTINTCNGNDCYSSYLPSHSTTYPGQPLGWTENEGWFQYWDPSSSQEYDANITGWANRSPEDMAYVLATWIAGGGSHHNYYMWYGGNHVGWTAGSSISSYYADGVNYHADGLANEPKRSHLMKLHNVLAENQQPILEDSMQYGNEMYIQSENSLKYSLAIEACDSNSVSQKFIYDETSKLLQ